MVEAGDGDAADVVVVQRSAEKRKERTKSHRQRGREEPSLKINSSKGAAVVLFRSILFESVPPFALSVLSPPLFVASRWEYNTSFHTDGEPSHLPRKCTVVHANIRAQSMIMSALNL